MKDSKKAIVAINDMINSNFAEIKCDALNAALNRLNNSLEILEEYVNEINNHQQYTENTAFEHSAINICDSQKESAFDEEKLLDVIDKWQRRYQKAEEKNDNLQKKLDNMQDKYNSLLANYNVVAERLDELIEYITKLEEEI